MIRAASVNDLDRLVELGEQMKKESPTYGPFNFDGEKLRNFIAVCIENEKGLVLVYEKDGVVIGAVMGWVDEQFFGHDRLLCDFGLFVESNKRGALAGGLLIKSYIEYGKAMGIEQIMLSNSTGVDISRVAGLYEKLGLKHTGFVFALNNKGE